MAPGMILDVAQDIRVQSLNAVVAGLGFASAIAWLDFIRWLISTLVRVKANGGQYFFMSALLTTLVAVLLTMVILRFGGKGVSKPGAPTYAVTR